MITRRRTARPWALTLPTVAVTAAVVLSSSGAAGVAPAELPPPSEPTAPEPPTTLYDPGDYEEDLLPDEFTGVGPFTGDFPCAGLSVSDAAQIVPGVAGATLDSGCYYYSTGDDGTTNFDDAFSVDVSEFASPDQSADWIFVVQQLFYNGAYPDGSPPDSEGCEWLDDLAPAGAGLTVAWCWAPNEFPVLALRADDIGVSIEWFGTPTLESGRDEQSDLAITTAIAEHIVPRMVSARSPR